MNISETDREDKSSVLEELFNRAKPKARYISESHIEEETNSITKEIINGDIEVNKTKGNVTVVLFSSIMHKKRIITRIC